MSEEQTSHFRSDNPVLQQILAKLEVMDTRLQFVETKITEHSYDTKPIWEQALSEILEVKNRLAGVEHELGHVKRELALVNKKIDVFNHDMLKLRADQLSTEERLRHLEP